VNNRTSWSTGPKTGATNTTGQIGALVGYNFALNDLWLVGVEGRGLWGPDTQHTAIGAPHGFPDTSTLRRSWKSDLLARVGLAVSPDVMLYGAGGIAAERLKLTITCSVPTTGPFSSCYFPFGTQRFTDHVMGWAAGGGVQATLTPNIDARFEYL